MALSDFLAPSLQIGSTILKAGSQQADIYSSLLVAKRRQALGEYEAQQLEQEAEQARGVGMRGAADEALKTEYMNSTALARAAASGAGSSDPTVMNVISRTAGEGAYRSALAMYEGESQARLDVQMAAAKRYEGSLSLRDWNADKVAGLNVANTLLTGGVKALSMYDKYFAGPVKDKTSDTSGATISAGNTSWLDTGTQSAEDIG